MISYSILQRLYIKCMVFVRYKHAPNHWSVLRKKIHATDKALTHFDDFYKQVFTINWPAIREGLLSQHKYVAIVNNYGDSTETMQNFELNGALNVRKLFALEKEYISEESKRQKRKKELEKIWDSANEKMDTEVTKVKTQEFQANKFSLKTSLDNAEYDMGRLVDKSNTLSTELLYEFIPATKIKGMEDFLFESSHYKLYDQNAEFVGSIEKEYDLHFPENLNIYCYESENNTQFPGAKKATTGVLNYYLMDGSSILPILALDLKPGCRFLDVCAAPGGKSLLAVQTLYPDLVVSNDIANSRLNRIEHVYKQFLYDFREKWQQPGRIRLSNSDARHLEEKDNFDRILVDVPCTTDRHSLMENDNNIFKPSRIKERLKLPELQCEILMQALKLVRKGGVVVYATCSLSPIQNDGVVHMALKQLWEDQKIKIIVKDLSPALRQTRSVFKFAEPNILKYGHLVIPDLSQNYGPMYFCKLKRIS